MKPLAQIDWLAQAKTDEERAVLMTILGRHRITQRNIIRHANWLGCHPKHEKHLSRNEWETTTRKVRQVISDLRKKRGIPILADYSGYYLPRTYEEILAHMDKLEKIHRAVTKSTYESYKALANHARTHNPYFKQLELWQNESSTSLAASA